MLTDSALTEAELDRLESFLTSIKNVDAMTLEGMDGFFCALIAGPETFAPSTYLPIIWGGELPDENAFATMEEANEVISLIMRHWNSIIADLDRDGMYVPVVDDEPDARGVAGRVWARGFLRGVELAKAGWNELFQSDNEGQLITIPLVAGEIDPEWPKEPLAKDKSDELLISMAAGLVRSYRHFKARRKPPLDARDEPTPYRRPEPKIGRNDPCVCGSGRKFKHCCGAPTTGTRH